MIPQVTLQGGRRKSRQEMRWEDNITEWTCLKLGEALRKAQNREGGKSGIARSSLVPQRSNRLEEKRSDLETFNENHTYRPYLKLPIYATQ